ncbi:lipopolysaccharide biosynthesis protein [Aristaeella hokkaidonensis]|uniref:Lipopolysaccharide biosynthesis protein n=1 Tax=Aristaeella hokkaidonensis TaxID=3046382 RepID=A0AC61NAA9_9FIRM|nr:lipopolysaccharide biosynthesis protein [Aristaeella hokkaidonensis]QUC68208.1 lipopolysaccharide biosynthesis protein [Aristaeella hokkaidonensis]SNT95232.1 Membrane protein involved in the export of O-antigen and teichoic acid [Aristaeella hokkaidonensis]
MVDKRNGTFSGIIWKFAERISAQLVSTIVSIILARILLPADYGVVSVVTILITIFNSFVTGGFGNALIQKKDADELDFNTMYYFSIVFSLVLYSVVFCLARPFASFYKNQDLVWVLRVMALRIPIAAINSIQQSYIAKNMQFRKFFFATIIGTVISAIVGITLALRGAGPWALVAQYLTNVIIDTIVLYIVSEWKPKLQFSIIRLKNLYKFAFRIMSISVLDALFNEIRSTVISIRYSATDLAIYDHGTKYPNLIVTNINSSIGSVIFPALSRCQSNKDEMRTLMKRAITFSSFALTPLLFGFATISNRFVDVILTSKWNGSIPYIIITCIMCLFYPMHTINIQALIAVGESKKVLVLDVIKKSMHILVLCFSMYYGVVGIAIGCAFVSIISTFINGFYSKRLFSYSIWSQLKDVLPYVITSCIMSIIVMIFDNYLLFHPVVTLIMDIVIGMTVYCVLAIVCKFEQLPYLIHKIQGIIFK